jgi:hypothetical protein
VSGPSPVELDPQTADDACRLFTPCGYRALRTGAMFASLETHRTWGPRKPNGRKFSDQEWEEYWPQHFEVVYRMRRSES